MIVLCFQRAQDDESCVSSPRFYLQSSLLAPGAMKELRDKKCLMILTVKSDSELVEGQRKPIDFEGSDEVSSGSEPEEGYSDGSQLGHGDLVPDKRKLRDVHPLLKAKMIAKKLKYSKNLSKAARNSLRSRKNITLYRYRKKLAEQAKDFQRVKMPEHQFQVSQINFIDFVLDYCLLPWKNILFALTSFVSLFST